MTELSAILAYGILGAAALLAPLHRARQMAVVSTVLVFVLVHTEVTQSAAALFVALGINVLVSLRVHDLPAAPVLLGAVVMWTAGRQTLAVPEIGEGGVYVVTAMVLLLLAGHVRRLGRDVVWSLQVIVAVTVVIQLISALGERLLAWDAPWPRRDGVTYNIGGSNNLWPELGGRAMGTLGWAITLGQMMALCAIMAFWFFVRSRRWGWLALTGAAVFVVFLSGTRTGLLMIAAAAVIGLVVRVKKLWAVLVLGSAVLAVIVVGPLVVGDLFGFGADVEGTRSVQHRRLVSGSIPGLLNQSTGSVIFGHGYDAVPGLLASGVIHGVEGAPVTDNELIRTLAGLGILGVGLWAGAFITAFIRGSALTRALVVALIVGGASYDILTWRSLLVLVVLILSMELRPQAKSRRSGPGDGVGRSLPARTQHVVGGGHQLSERPTVEEAEDGEVGREAEERAGGEADARMHRQQQQQTVSDAAP